MFKVLLFSFFFSFTFLYGKLHVVVSILPQQTFVEQIGGDKVEVTTMVKPGSDPHTYEPKPSQMRAISKAHIYFPIQIEFENVWLKKFQEQNQNMQISDIAKGVKFIQMPQNITLNTKIDEKMLPFEWVGLFELKKGHYTWHFDKVGTDYADPKMKFLMIHAKKRGDDLISHYKPQATRLFSSNETLKAYHTDSIALDKKVYALNFDTTRKQTQYKLEIKEDGKYLFFTEHFPFEFEDKEHFFKDNKRHDIEPIAMHPDSGANHHHHHHHGGVDPHTWTAPSNVKIMAKNILEALVKLDENNRAYYEKNYEVFLNMVDNTDKRIKEIFSSLPKDAKFMVFHPSWGYFAKEYNLTQLSIEVEGKEPKPKMLKQIIDIAKKEEIKAIFTQQEFSDKSAKTIAKALYINVLKETPLAKEWSQNLINMAQAIANQ